jgi:hypothetical protein
MHKLFFFCKLINSFEQMDSYFCLILLDLTKAFDCIYYIILLKKLHKIVNSVFYLMYISQLENVYRGVSQGNILGPTLFPSTYISR